jgi:hypothetical protein
LNPSTFHSLSSSYEWSILFLLILIAAVLAMMFHVWTLWKRRSALTAYDILFVAFFFASLVQFGPMMSQVGIRQQSGREEPRVEIADNQRGGHAVAARLKVLMPMAPVTLQQVTSVVKLTRK